VSPLLCRPSDAAGADEVQMGQAKLSAGQVMQSKVGDVTALAAISPGSIVVPRHVITWLQMYGMSENFLMAPLTPSWISWLEDQRLANSAPQDAMLGDPFQPGVGEVFPPHPNMLAPPLVHVVYAHDQVHGVPCAGGSEPAKRAKKDSGPAYQTGSSASTGRMDVNMEIAGSSSIDSMEEPDVFNEGIRGEDEMKVYNVPPKFHEVSFRCRFRTDEAFAAHKLNMARCYHSYKHLRLSSDSSVIDEILWNGSKSTDADYAWTADALLYYCWKGVVPMMLFLQQPFRPIILLDLIDAADLVVWPLRMNDTVFEPTSAKVKTWPPTFEGSRTTTTTTTTKARVDEDVAKIDQLRSDEVGPTTCSRLRIINENETEEVRRHVQNEAIYSDAQARVADEEQLAASPL
jgi:hypothetical protein